MKRETEEWYGEFKLLFQTKGWSQFIEEQNKTLEQLKHIILHDRLSHDDYLGCLGELARLGAILHFQEDIERDIEQLEYEEEEEEDNAIRL